MNTLPKVYINYKECDVTSIVELHLTEDMFEELPTAMLRVKDITGLLSSSINIGVPVTIQLRNSVNTLVTYDFLVSYFRKELEPQSGILSDIYFGLQSTYKTGYPKIQRAYFGAASTIIETIAHEYGDKLQLGIVESSEDLVNIRYTQNRNAIEFLSSVSRFAIKNNEAMFFYSDLNRKLHLLSEKTIYTATPKATIALLFDTSLETLTNTTSNYLSALSAAAYGQAIASDHIIHTSADGLTTSSVEKLQHHQTAINSIPYEQHVNALWEYSPLESRAILAKEVLVKRVNAASTTLLLPFHKYPSIDLGAIVKLQFDNRIDYKETGNYFIKKIEYVFENKVAYTKLILVKV